MVLLYGAELRCGNRATGSPAPREVKRMAGAPCPRTSGIRRSAAAIRRCTPASRRASPATRAVGLRKTCRRFWSRRSTSRYSSRLTESVARSPSARRSSLSWSESAGANLSATKMLIDMMKDIGRRTDAEPPPEPRRGNQRRRGADTGSPAAGNPRHERGEPHGRR